MNVVSDKTCWVFVTHNVADLQSPASLKDAIEVHWQQEKGGKTGRLHLQGYVRFRFPKSRAQCQEMLPGWWHIRHGSHEQAIKYCTKDATRVSDPTSSRASTSNLTFQASKSRMRSSTFRRKIKDQLHVNDTRVSPHDSSPYACNGRSPSFAQRPHKPIYWLTYRSPNLVLQGRAVAYHAFDGHRQIA